MNISKRKKILLLLVACFFVAGFNFFAEAANNAIKGCDTSIDSDCDDLTNEEEKLYGTDPLISDSGNCGYSDGVSVRAGYNPLTCKQQNTPQQKKITANSLAVTPTTQFSDQIKGLIETKGEKNVTNVELDTLIENNVNQNMGETVSFENLPTINTAKIQIKPQQYADLTETERKSKLKEDAQEYLKQLVLLFVTNVPENGNLDSLWKTFQEKAETVSTETPDYQYFRDLGDKLLIFSEQANEMIVPETIIDSHVKLLRIIAGFIILKDPATPQMEDMDPMSKLTTLSKAKDLFQILFELVSQVQTQFRQIN